MNEKEWKKQERQSHELCKFFAFGAYIVLEIKIYNEIAILLVYIIHKTVKYISIEKIVLCFNSICYQILRVIAKLPKSDAYVSVGKLLQICKIEGKQCQSPETSAHLQQNKSSTQKKNIAIIKTYMSV